MVLEALAKVGLTKGEIRVYSALLGLGKSGTGEIMKKSAISSSKVYLILDKLVEKGLVSFTLENNIKKFQTTTPRTIIDLINKQEKDLESTKIEIEKLIPKIEELSRQDKKEYSQIYKGVRGIESIYNKLLDEFNRGEEYYIFTVSGEESHSPIVVDFFKEFHKRRIEKGVKLKAIADSEVYSEYKKKHVFGSLYSMKHSELKIPLGTIVGKTRVVFTIFGEDSIAFEIVSQRIVGRYKAFFERLWKIAKK